MILKTADNWNRISLELVLHVYNMYISITLVDITNSFKSHHSRNSTEIYIGDLYTLIPYTYINYSNIIFYNLIFCSINFAIKIKCHYGIKVNCS